MVKVHTPLFSVEARGKFASVLTFSKRQAVAPISGRPGHSGQQVRFQTSPKFKYTAGRVVQNELYSDAVSAWNNLSSIEKMEWNDQANGKFMTGYNLFVKTFLLGNIPSTDSAAFGAFVFGSSAFGAT